MTRKRIIVKARELSEMDVDTISLVKRGANRIPFRITKSGDNDMSLDLGSLFFMKKEQKPEVIGVVIANIDNAEDYINTLKDAGLAVDHVSKSEDKENPSATLMMIKADEIPADAVAFKVDEHSAVVVAGVKKGLDAYPDAQDFIENIQKAGFYPAFRTASDMLNATIGNIMYSEGDAEMTKTSVSKALGDFKGYVDAVLSTVPVTAFKAEEVLLAKGALLGTGADESSKTPEEVAEETTAAAAESKEQAENEQKERAESGAESGDETAAEEPAKEEPAEKAKEAPAKEPAKAKAPAKEADKSPDAAVAKSEDNSQADILAAISGLQKSVDGVAASIDTKIAAAIQPLNESLDSANAKLKKAEEAIQGTVHSEVPEDQEAGVTTQKSQSLDWSSELDFGDGVERV